MSDVFRKVIRTKRIMASIGYEDKHPAACILDLVGLIRHMQVHAAYKKCGYSRMTTEQKALFRRINCGEFDRVTEDLP